ncbi:hypothetical protein [Devosia sp. 2618]|uniref:hypothetical protein n=1 Tax=Devosia sp. 2618 TaxID=3156454 RepID=UPI003393D130
MATTLRLSADASVIEQWLAALTEALEAFPEFGHCGVGLLEAGDPLFIVDIDSAAASAADHFVVSFKPSDGLVGLVTAFRASHPDFGFFEHALSSLSEASIAERTDGVESDG